MPATAAAADGSAPITLLYHLTKRAMCSWSGQDYDACQLTADAQTAIETKAALCTTYGNQVLDNSNITVTWEIVGVYVDMVYDEGSSMSTQTRLKDVFDAVNSRSTTGPLDLLLRQYSADLLVDVFWNYRLTGLGRGAAGRGYVPDRVPMRRYAMSVSTGVFGYVSCCVPESSLRCSANARVNNRFLSKCVHMSATIYHHT